MRKHTIRGYLSYLFGHWKDAKLHFYALGVLIVVAAFFTLVRMGVLAHSLQISGSAQMKISKNGEIIQSVDDWLRLAHPKRAKLHWQDGRSAKELAKAWFPTGGGNSVPVIPREFSDLLESSDVLGEIKLCEGEPEVVVRFDSFQGEPRNSDLLIGAACQLGKIEISVEAKADEVFGSTIGYALDGCKKRNKDASNTANPGKFSRVADRIEHLATAVLNMDVEDCRKLRYQLLYGTAATLSAAAQHDALIAIFIVHEFITERTKDANHKRNAADLDRFVRALSRDNTLSVQPGHLLGPFRVPGNAYIPRSVDFFIGKAIQDLRNSSGN
jgi:hypothetical protein